MDFLSGIWEKSIKYPSKLLFIDCCLSRPSLGLTCIPCLLLLMHLLWFPRVITIVNLVSLVYSANPLFAPNARILAGMVPFNMFAGEMLIFCIVLLENS